ncbi:MAG: hypothetical protein ACYDB2_04350 [Acidimicrobiales bacterium]
MVKSAKIEEKLARSNLSSASIRLTCGRIAPSAPTRDVSRAPDDGLGTDQPRDVARSSSD